MKFGVESYRFRPFTVGIIATTLALVCAVGGGTLLVRRASVTRFPSDEALLRHTAWLALGGRWTLHGTEIDNSSEERGAKLMTRLGSWHNYQVQADIQFAEPFGQAGIIIRSHGEEGGVDSYHGYFAGIRVTDSTLDFGRADFGWNPLARIALPPESPADLRGWFHLRVVAVDCRFGIILTTPDGQMRAATVQATDCLASGHFGLRSVSAAARWRNIRVSSASLLDLEDVQAAANHDATLPLAGLCAAAELERCEASIRGEATRHAFRGIAQPIGTFLMSPGRHPDVTIQGVIISAPPFTDIEDDTGTVLVPSIGPRTLLRRGDVVEAQGTIVTDRFRRRLEHARIRILWSGHPVPPLAVTATELAQRFRGLSIEVEGTLLSKTMRGSDYDLILQDGNVIFCGVGSASFDVDPTSLKIGSRLRLSGMATSLPTFTGSVYPFAVLIDQIDVLHGPPWWSPQHIVLVLLAITVFLVGLEILIQRLQQWHFRSVLKEREDLAFEIHDTLAQSFTGIAYQLRAACLEHGSDSELRRHIRKALDMVDLSHKEASRTIAALRPQFRDAAKLLSTLAESAERLTDSHPFHVRTVLNGRNARLPVKIADAFFRIGQEAISNAAQHSACTALQLTLSLSRREARLHIRDDGHGFEPTAVGAGLGIEGMKLRAKGIRGELVILSFPGQGTTITATAQLQLTGGLFSRLSGSLKRLWRE